MPNSPCTIYTICTTNAEHKMHAAQATDFSRISFPGLYSAYCHPCAIHDMAEEYEAGSGMINLVYAITIISINLLCPS